MPTYMVQATYTSAAWNKLVQRPENRMEALNPVIAKLGGEILAWYYTFGDYDVVVLFEVPSNVNAAAASMAIAGSGAVKDFKTTMLMSPDEGFDAMLLAQGAGYQPPGA
jgi:uncharacterized protein with GYD domain